MTVKPTQVRLLQALAFGLGALALEALVERGSVAFSWTPAIIGLAYLGAAVAGGRDGGHWPTALVLLGWGAVVAWAGETRPQDIDLAGAYLAGGGAGVLAGALLARRGWSVDPLGLGGATVGAGLVLALAPRVDALVEARTFALALLAVALVNAVLALARRRR